MKKLLLSVIAALALSIVSSPARAASTVSGYVCYVDQYNYSGLGSYGGVLAAVYSSANCAGNFLGFFYACSVNATSNVCSSSYYSAYSEAQMLSQFQALLDTARLGKRISAVFSNSCKSGGTNCNGDINYFTY